MRDLFFAHPLVLWLLPLAAVLPGWAWRAAPRRRAAVALLRAGAVACLILAAAKPLWLSRRAAPVRVEVVDCSPTVPASAILAAARTLSAADLRLVAFASRSTRLATIDGLSDPLRLAALRGQLDVPLWTDDPADGGADLADALRLAGGLVPWGDAGAVDLYTNGLSTHGDPAAEAVRLARRGIAVHVTPWPVQSPGPAATALLRSLSLPAAGRVGQSLPALLTIESTTSQRVHVTLRGGEAPPAGGDIDLRPGLNRATVPLPLIRPGMLTVQATLAGASVDPAPAVAAVRVQGPIGVCVVRDPAQPDGTAAALVSVLGPTSTVREISPAALDAASLDPAAVIVLSNLPAGELSPAAQARLRDAVVRDGKGLLVCGEERSFGSGGYADSPVLEPMLPVRMPRPAQQLDPSVALVLVIDTSGSMSGVRLDLAKEVARLAIARLTPTDKAGIVEFYASRRWAAPLQTVGDKAEIDRELDRLSAGGGTILYPAVEEAAFALRNVAARSRNVLILSDGDVENTPFEALARQMAQDGILVSAGRCGNPAGEGEFLSNLAHWGGGRYYQVDDRFELPDITFKRPRLRPISPVVFQAERVRLGDDPLAASLAPASWPEVTQFVRTPAKPTADVLLSTAGGDPLLARWRYGAGWVATLSLAPGTPAALPLESSPQFGPMLRTLLQTIAPAPDPLRVRPILRPAGLEVAVDAARPDASITLPIDVTVRSGERVVRSSQVQPTAVGRWNVLFPDVPAGTYRLDAAVVQPNGSPAPLAGSAAVAVPTPRAFSRFTPDTDLLAALATPPPVDPGPASPVVPVASGPIRELWIPLALLALVFFLLHVAARRWPHRSAERVKVQATAPPTRAAPPVAAVASIALLLGVVPSARGVVPTTSPATQPASMQERIQAELVRTGDVQSLADELARQHPADPAARQQWTADRAALAWEQGNLPEEIRLLQALAAARPDDPDVLRQLATADEMAGDVQGAEQNWRRILSMHPPRAMADDARLRLAALLLDQGQTKPGVDLLAQTRTDDPLRWSAGIVATLYGQDALAAQLLPAPAAKSPYDASADRLADILGAEADLRLGRAAAAQAAFARARKASPDLADQRYLAEREVAAARQAGTADALAGRWVDEGDRLPIACVAPLASLLRDAGQVDRLLAWWSLLAASPQADHRDAALASDVSDEIVGAAADAHRGADAQAVAGKVLDRNPQSLAALDSAARVALNLDDPATADALLNRRVGTAEEADELRSLGNLAASLGRQTVAERCARLLEAMGGDDAVSGLLLRASLLGHRADVPGQVKLLQQAARAVVDPGQAQAVATALDAAGEGPSAITLLQRITTPGAPSARSDAIEDPLDQLAWLLEKAGRVGEAVAVWQRLWHAADTPAGRVQAERHLIKLAVRSGTLSQLRDQAAARLRGEHPTAADLSLRVDADVQAGDVAGAVDAINASPVAGTATDRLQAIADVELRSTRLAEAEAALQRLSAAQANDPAARRITLERIAEVELSLRRPDLARQAIDAAAQDQDSATAASLLAGILSRSARPASASREYRRAIAAGGGTSDANQWLLWAQAMIRAGQRDAAVARLQLLCVDAARAGNDSLLGIGVDGLLNLDAPVEALRPVRRLVMLRVAARPQQRLPGQLLSDLSGQLGDAALGRRATEVSLAAETEERSDTLRSLIDASRSAGQTEAARDYSQRLLALGEDLPPSLFLDLGEQFLAGGQDDAAIRAFARATEVTTDDVVCRRAAALLERADRPSAAARLLAPLAARLPGDVALQDELAGCYESNREEARAESLYTAALQVGLKRIAVDAGVSSADGGGGPKPKAPRPVRAMPRPAPLVKVEVTAPDPLPDDIRLPLQGALTCAGDDAQRDAVLQAVLRCADERLSAVAAPAPGAPSAGVTPPPDVLLAAAVLRAASFSAAKPDVADEFDRRLLQRWPTATPLRQTLVQTRLWWGLYDRATSFVAGDQPRPPPSVGTAASAAADAAGGAGLVGQHAPGRRVASPRAGR